MAKMQFDKTNLPLNEQDIAEIDDASIVDDLGADSLEMVQIVMLIEDEFGIAIPDEPAEEFLTVRDAIDFVVASQS